MDSSAEPRRRLNRNRVLDAAVGLADESGVEALTMRRLGERLGVEAMSLYKHVAGKEDILDGIVDLVIGEIDMPSPGSDWRSAMRQRAESARRVLVRHPWAIGMMESQSTLGPNALRYVDAVIGTLRQAGFPIRMAAHAFVLLDSFVYGLVVQEVAMPTVGADASELSPEFATEFPYLAEMIASHATGPGYSYDEEFEFGIEQLLDILERARQDANPGL